MENLLVSSCVLVGAYVITLCVGGGEVENSFVGTSTARNEFYFDFPP